MLEGCQNRNIDSKFSDTMYWQVADRPGMEGPEYLVRDDSEVKEEGMVIIFEQAGKERKGKGKGKGKLGEGEWERTLSGEFWRCELIGELVSCVGWRGLI